jgi:hypothetical protein
MEPTRDAHTTLVDLLDRVLEKGLVLNADLLINVAGIPLLGVNLRACLAGIDTMLKYGIWQDWDTAQRAIATKKWQQERAQEPMKTLELEPKQNLWPSVDSEIATELLCEEEVTLCLSNSTP